MGRVTAAALDAVCVVAFAALGRASHGEALDLVGVTTTAFPFLIAAAVGWALVLLRKRDGVAPTDGVWIWLVTLAGGMVLRRLLGDGTALAFVIVAALALALLLIGWRGVARLVRRTPAPRA
ncbi:DUF3054 domain-containing protein [Propioniciclava soli]|uniref:DUF3054 domain-containing protein n=1 Tax=Propioniciclava soli TaxID=2775081 RepID=UPI001E5F6FA5|nr:DUF3054 domain-containing protein [Propioniciclava soli]